MSCRAVFGPKICLILRSTAFLQKKGHCYARDTVIQPIRLQAIQAARDYLDPSSSDQDPGDMKCCAQRNLNRMGLVTGLPGLAASPGRSAVVLPFVLCACYSSLACIIRLTSSCDSTSSQSAKDTCSSRSSLVHLLASRSCSRSGTSADSTAR
ncbi:uncharacterized protein BJX67DRAFT_1519 [Aspergillus lucknowensis]|uniref:Uncharacterized protein n=1 Tax=Aspergillus lucknowensis TaxID=176173 RepID=A0ABR4M6P1_9EURO